MSNSSTMGMTPMKIYVTISRWRSLHMICRQAHWEVSSTEQIAKLRVQNIAQPLSFDPDAEAVIQRSALKMMVNAPNQSVTRLNLVPGRRIRFARPMTALNCGSMISIFDLLSTRHKRLPPARQRCLA